MALILIACEESQAICLAFRNAGHEAYSCDLQECSGGHPEWHIQGDAIEAMRALDFYGNDDCRKDNEWNPFTRKWEVTPEGRKKLIST